MKRRSGLLTIIFLASMLSLACSLILPSAVTPIPTSLMTGTPAATAGEPQTATVETSATPIPVTPVPAAVLPVLGSKSIQEKSTQPAYTVQVDYAVMAGDAALIGPFNQAMDAFVSKTVSGFKQDASQALDAQTGGSSIDIRFTTPLVSGKAISLLYTVYVYYAGAAHPNSYSVTFTYDLAKKQMLVLRDLFKPGADYLDPISAYCTTELKKTLADAFLEDGASPKEDNYKNWMLQLDGLQFQFDPYQVGPYAAGPQKVVIPMSVIKDIILPGGILDHSSE
jgi:hypothetical protein